MVDWCPRTISEVPGEEVGFLKGKFRVGDYIHIDEKGRETYDYS